MTTNTSDWSLAYSFHHKIYHSTRLGDLKIRCGAKSIYLRISMDVGTVLLPDDAIQRVPINLLDVGEAVVHDDPSIVCLGYVALNEGLGKHLPLDCPSKDHHL